MVELVKDACQWFWNDDVWLPPNVTWDSFHSQQVEQEAVLHWQPVCAGGGRGGPPAGGLRQVRGPPVPDTSGAGGDGGQALCGALVLQAPGAGSGSEGQEATKTCGEPCVREGLQGGGLGGGRAGQGGRAVMYTGRGGLSCVQVGGVCHVYR